LRGASDGAGKQGFNMSKEYYEAKLPIITAIPEEKLFSPNMPIKTYLEEAEFLHDWCQPDQEALVGAGLDWEVVEDIPVRAGALRIAEMVWHRERFNQEEAVKQWEKNSAVGYDFRNVLLHTFFHAYEHDTRLLSRVSNIAEGYGHGDMIQDLTNLAGMGRANIEPLKAIRYDLSELDRAELLSSQLARMLAAAQVDRKEKSPELIIRDQAYTHLKHAVDAIRSKGQYLFWRTEKRLEGYASQYHRRSNAQSSNESSQSSGESVGGPNLGTQAE
jgi:hypothetical protein